MRLFTTLWPDAAVTDDVDALVAEHVDPGVWRATASARRHVTLCFHGDVEPASVPRPGAGRAPRLRCEGAGVFGDALWLGVTASEPARLAELVGAAGGDPGAHVAHLTIARRRRDADPDAPVPPGLETHVGPWWTPTEVALVASGRPYRVLDRVVLG